MTAIIGTEAPYEEGIAPLRAGLERADLNALAGDVASSLAEAGVTWGADNGPFRVDPVPRLIAAGEWAELERGIVQRTRALDRFVADVYGRQRIVREKVVPAGAIRSAAFFEPQLHSRVHGDDSHWITIAGLDLVRCPDGHFRVLEDNVRTPSGIAYALAARAAVQEHLPTPDGFGPEPLEPTLAGLGAALRAAAPEGVEEPVVAILTDGPGNIAFFDHRDLADRLGVALVRLVDLRLSGGRLHARTDGGVVPVDVVYRRTNEDRLNDPRGGLTNVAELLLEPWSRGKLGLVNAFGAGVADDKLLHAYVEDMVRFYLEEEPLLESVPTWDLTRPGALNRAIENVDRLVVKPRAGHGGAGVVVGPYAAAHERERAAAALRSAPGEHVVQEVAPLSLHPTICGGRLEQRHVDLRPFVFLAGDDAHVLPGGLTRVAFGEGDMIVNSSRDGGAKDTWVVP